jgi:hypothetical protein
MGWYGQRIATGTTVKQFFETEYAGHMVDISVKGTTARVRGNGGTGAVLKQR